MDEKIPYATKWQRANKDKLNRKAREKYKRDPRLARHYQLKKLYGISIDEFEALVKNQENRCAACGGPPIVKPTLYVDHCHSTGKVRGLLCQRCNVIAGQAGDNPTLLRIVAEYLERTK